MKFQWNNAKCRKKRQNESSHEAKLLNQVFADPFEQCQWPVSTQHFALKSSECDLDNKVRNLQPLL